MEFISILFTITLISLAGWITPGPNMFAVINASISNGKMHGFFTGLGISAAGVLWAGLAVFGVDTLFTLFPKLIFSLRIIGATYLIWLGLNAFLKAYQGNMCI